MQPPARPDPGPSELDVRIDRRPDQATVWIVGEIDMMTAGRLDAALTGLGDQGCTTIEVDLSGVGFIAAAGLAVLVEHDRRCRDAAGRFLVVRPSPVCSRLFALTGLDATLVIC